METFHVHGNQRSKHIARGVLQDDFYRKSRVERILMQLFYFYETCGNSLLRRISMGNNRVWQSQWTSSLAIIVLLEQNNLCNYISFWNGHAATLAFK